MIRIYIGNTELDLTGTERMQVKYQSAPIGQALAPSAAFSVEMQLPDTSKNIAAFGYNDIVTTVDTAIFNAYDCRVEDDGVDMRLTLCQVRSFSPLIVRFYGEALSFFSLIKDGKLSDMDLSNIDHTWDASTITGGLLLSNYSYPIINYGVLTEDSNQVPVEYMYPAIDVPYLITRMIEDEGYTESNALSGDLHYDKLILPFSNKRIRTITDDEKESVGFEVYSSGQSITLLTETELTFANEVTDPGSNFASNRYTAPYDMFASFYFKCNCKSAVALTNTNVTFALYKDDGVTPVLLNTGTYNVGDTFTDVVVVEFQMQHQIEAGMEIYITATPLSQNLSIQGGVDGSGDGYTRWQFLTLIDTMILGFTWRVGINLPDITKSQLFEYVLRSFAAIATVDEVRKIVTITQLDTILANKTNGYNWTDKLDLSQPVTKTFDFPAEVGQLTYLKYLDDDNVVKPAGTDITVTVNSVTLEKEKTLYTAPFAASENESKFTIGLFVPNIEINGESELKPRILLNRTRRSTEALSFTEGGVEVDTAGIINVPYFYDFANSYDLTWAKLRNSNLTNCLTMITNPRGIECSVRLNQVDINQLDYTKPVYIGTAGDEVIEAWFYISEILYDTDGVSRVKLNLIP